MDISAAKKNIFKPPPQFPNLPQTSSRPLGPSPSWRPPPSWDFRSKKATLPSSRRLGLPLPPPRGEKNIKYPKRLPRRSVRTALLESIGRGEFSSCRFCHGFLREFSLGMSWGPLARFKKRQNDTKNIQEEEGPEKSATNTKRHSRPQITLAT